MDISDILFGHRVLVSFGMTLMGDGLKQVAGNKLEVILYKLTGIHLKDSCLEQEYHGHSIFFCTSIMVVGFVNSGIMKVRQAIPIVLGAIFGTSITVGLSAFRTQCGSVGSCCSPPLR